jgi:ammonium transporter, Amt family
MGYSFVGTCAILFVMNLIPGLSLRCSADAEIIGTDDAEMGEFAYDYVEITRETPSIETLEGGATTHRREESQGSTSDIVHESMSAKQA